MPAPTALPLPAVHPFVARDVPWLVDEQARLRPDRTYLIWESFEGPAQNWSYAAFAEETRAYAAGLAAHGVKRGEFVLLHADNCPEFLFTWHACSRLGAVVVTTNTHSTHEELAYFAEKSGAVVAITQPAYLSLFEEIGPSVRWIACIGDTADNRPDNVIPFSNLRADPTTRPARATADALAPNSIQFTSGTTSRPKGVVWTHANALWAARTMASVLELDQHDRTIVHFPLFHTNALAYSMLSTLWAGGSAVLTPRFSASRFWDLSLRHGCTWASMSPFPLRALLPLADPPAHRYRFWAFAGDLSIARDRWGIRTTGWYGMTETVAACITSEQGFPGTEGAMGRLRPEYQISIRREDGTEVEQGEIGRLFVRGIPGLSLFYEYLHDPEATAEAFDAEGWFDTGDEISINAAGDLIFASRAKDMLKVGGENVGALEIETVIAGVPGVVECAVVGKPDPMRDEVPVAFVVANSPGGALETMILETCEARLSAFKRPREIRFIDALPTGLLGKVLKRDLREMLTDAS